MINKAKKENIEMWIEGMNRFNSTPEFGTTRILFTKPEIENRNYVKDEMRKLGLVVTEDAIGNIFATLKGTDPEKKPVWTGSHIDTVPNAGKFDGMSGVVCGMEALRIIKESGIEHKRDLSVIVYTSEEPTRFSLGCLGSRAMSGDMTLEDTKTLYDKSGRSLYEKLEELSYDLTKYDEIKREKGDVYATIELHVEQNSQLEKKKLPIGIVKKICAPSNYVVEVTGCQSHAGGTSMEDRKDAFAAACEMGMELEKLAKECISEYNTATIGSVKVIPDATNVIPGTCIFTVDIRDCNMDTKNKMVEDFQKKFKEIANKRNVTVNITEDNNDVPLTCNNKIINLLEDNCKELGLGYTELISGPFHDSLFVGKFAPTAMIFVPSKNGISHSPEEWTDYEELARGTDLLASTLVQLANMDDDL